MKRLGLILCALALAVFLAIVISGCASRAITIPDEPQYRQMSIYQLDGGVCFDDENADILLENLKLMKKYQADLRRLLEETR